MSRIYYAPHRFFPLAVHKTKRHLPFRVSVWFLRTTIDTKLTCISPNSLFMMSPVETVEILRTFREQAQLCRKRLQKNFLGKKFKKKTPVK